MINELFASGWKNQQNPPYLLGRLYCTLSYLAYLSLMQKLYKTSDTSTLNMRCEPDIEEESVDLLVIELVVPVAAKIPVLRQPMSTAAPQLRPASVTSTVPGKIYLQLRANNTASSPAWCTTATLATSHSIPQPRF
jgi:hypothetical protein